MFYISYLPIISNKVFNGIDGATHANYNKLNLGRLFSKI